MRELTMHPIKTYCKKHKLTVNDIANHTWKPRYIYHVMCGYRQPSTAFALFIEELTGGEVGRLDILYFVKQDSVKKKKKFKRKIATT